MESEEKGAEEREWSMSMSDLREWIKEMGWKGGGGSGENGGEVGGMD